MMRHYAGVVDGDEDAAWGIWFPDVLGCVSAADSLDDLMANAIEALSLHLEDVADPPEARTLDDIRREVAEELSEGAMLMLVPWWRTRGTVRRINVSMDAGTVEAIDAAAARRRLTRSAFLAEAAINEIEGRR